MSQIFPTAYLPSIEYMSLFLKTENATEPWVHVTSISIIVAVLALAVYSVYIRKKRSRHYRMRDKNLAQKKESSK